MEKNNTNLSDISDIKVMPNIGRIIGFLIAYGIFGVAVFLYFRSYTTFLFLVVFLIIPFISIMMLRSMLKHITVKLFASEDRSVVGNDLGIGIIISNESIFSSLRCRCHLLIKNVYYEEEVSQIFTVPIVARSENKNPLYCKVTNCGIIEASLIKCEISDVLGFVKAVVPSDHMISITIMPKQTNLDDIQKLGILTGFTDNEDDSQKGNEYSDTSNIREYIPGDRIKDIHWKLSAKRDVLLVREHIKSCENQLVLWVDSSPRKKYCEQILALTLSVGAFCLKENTLVRIMWYDKKLEGVNERIVNSMRDLEKAFDAIYLSGRSTAVSDLRSLLIMNDYNMKTVLRVGFDGSEVGFAPYEI